MGRKFERNLMNVPEPKNLRGSEPSPHVIIGDEPFALKPYLLRPFPYKQSKSDVCKENYNARLSVERDFRYISTKLAYIL